MNNDSTHHFAIIRKHYSREHNKTFTYIMKQEFY